MADERLLLQLRDQRTDALDVMMKKYHGYVYTVIANILGRAGGHEDIEELLQDTFYSVWTHTENIRPGKLKAYLGTTARNQAKSWLRSRRTLPMASDVIEIADPDGSLEDEAVRRELAQRLRRAVHQLRPKDREIFLRHYYYLQTAEEIARRMGIPKNTVLSCLLRGRKKLNKILSQEDLL